MSKLLKRYLASDLIHDGRPLAILRNNPAQRLRSADGNRLRA